MGKRMHWRGIASARKSLRGASMTVRASRLQNVDRDFHLTPAAKKSCLVRKVPLRAGTVKAAQSANPERLF